MFSGGLPVLWAHSGITCKDRCVRGILWDIKTFECDHTQHKLDDPRSYIYLLRSTSAANDAATRQACMPFNMRVLGP